MTRAGEGATDSGDDPTTDDRPVTYHQALRNREFRGLVCAQITSECGDHFARVAIAALILRQDGSVLLAALAFAVSYIPGLLGSALLSPFADRLPRRRVLVFSDLVRCLIVSVLALLAVPGAPIWMLYLLLVLAELFTGPFDAARAALLPDVFDDPRGYLAGASFMRFLFQANQVIGLVLAGLIVALVSPRGALVADAASFLASLVVIQAFVRRRQALAGEPHAGVTGLLRDVLDGARVVFSNPARRAIVIFGWTAAVFMIAPEAVALAYAGDQGESEVWGGLLMASVPAGAAVGAVIIGRAPHEAQIRALPRLVMGMCLPMLVIAAAPPVTVTAGLWFLIGVCQGYMATLIATLNVLTPPDYRGRVNGLAAAGFSVATAAAFVLAGWLADATSPALAVALAGLAGVAVVTANWVNWPVSALLSQVRAAYEESARGSQPVQSPHGGS
jgi:MFS family permease